MVVTAQQTGMLTKDEVVAYVGANANRFGLDPAAVLAVANQEGLKTQPGSVWQLPKEPYKSFGPPSWYGGGAGSAIVQQQGSPEAASAWSWTPAGIDYWLQKVQEAGASGLTGAAAIRQIIGGYGWGFERPAAENAASENINAARDYPGFVQQIQQGTTNQAGGNQIVPVPGQPGVITIPQIPGQFPAPINPQQPKPQTTSSAKFSLHLFDLPTGPMNLTLPWDFSGILMFLAAIFAIIIGALLWKPSREGIAMVAA
ncbi:MAG TPA: hypothetical protein VH593_20395 [Ktedonobacteraceae bacterium]|jgi:hypothetical protein